jgi:predicted nucleic acid-binding protein
MSDKFFIDTNIFVYTFCPAEPVKQHKSLEIVRTALNQGTGCISSQVVQEFINVALKKFTHPLSTTDCRRYLDAVLVPLCEVYPGNALYYKSLELFDRNHIAYYDSLIVAAALQAGCVRLYTEDMQQGQHFESLLVLNPFVA